MRRAQLGARKGLLGLVERREPLLDVSEPLLGRVGGGSRSSCQVGLHLEEQTLARLELALAAAELVRMRREAGLGVFEGLRVARGQVESAPVHCGERISELALPLFDDCDALGQLTTKASELLLGRDPNRSQAVVLALDRDGLELLLPE